MAKENTVLLYGYLEDKPIIKFHNEEPIYVRMALHTLRKTYSNNLILSGPEREDVITVFTRNKELMQKIWDFRMKNDDEDDPFLRCMFFIKGTLSTKYFPRQMVCRECGEVYRQDYFLTYVDPVNIHFWEFPRKKDAVDLVKEKIEVSNLIFMWGTLVRNPSIYPSMNVIQEAQGPLPKIECEFQVASNRKRKILEDTPFDTTDYPWVKIFGQKAVDAFESLSMGDEIYMHGSIESRLVENKHECPNCHAIGTTKDRVMEIIPYQIMTHDKENTAFLYGKIQSVPEFDMDENGNITMIQFHLLTVRRYKDMKLNLFKRNIYDAPLIRITNPVLIKQFQNFQKKKLNENKNYSILQSMVFIKGVLCTSDIQLPMDCPYCHSEYLKWTTRCYVDVNNFYFWGEIANNRDAVQLLNDRYDISNLLFLHGVLCDDPDLYPNTSLFVHPSQRQCEFQLTSKKTRTPNDAKETDLYPWVRIRGNRALTAKEALRKDSEIFIYGSIEANKALCYNTCPHCGKIFQEEENVCEIVPYSIEYGDNCIKPEGTHGGSLDEDEFNQDTAIEEGDET